MRRFRFFPMAAVLFGAVVLLASAATFNVTLDCSAATTT